MTNNNDIIYDALAKKFNLSSDRVLKICSSQFEFVVQTMTEGKLAAVRLPYMGVWRVKPAREKALRELGQL